MENEIVNLLIAIVGGLLAVLIAVIGWIGNRIHNRLDSISTSLASIEKDLRGELTHLDRRVSKIEIEHGQ